MGTSKALLDAGGRSFLSAVVGALVGGGCDPVLVVVAPGRHAEQRQARAAGATVLVNPEPGEGPITSLRLALTSLPSGTEGVAFCPVDHPLLQPETVAQLLEVFDAGDAPVVLPTMEGRRGHPAVFRDTVFSDLMDPTLEGGARAVVHRFAGAAAMVEVTDRGALTDVDTPGAYREAFGSTTGDL
jgi:CTP:molybdopterin cytidylyltransferase MocA